MTYDFSPLANQSSIITAYTLANTFTANLYGVFLLAMIGLGLFFYLQKFNTLRSAAAASTFTMAIVATLFSIMGWVSVYVPGACIVLFMLSVVFLYYIPG